MIKEIARIISIWIIVLPFIAGFINFRGLNRDSRWIFFLVIAGLIPQLLTFFVNTESQILSFSYNLYTLAEVSMLSALFRPKFQTGFSRAIQSFSLLVYISVAFWLIFQSGMIDRFLNELVCANNILFMTWILIYFREQFTNPQGEIHKYSPFAWYLLGWIIYAPCSVVLFALYYYIREPENIRLLNLWIIQSGMNILLYICFAIGLFLRPQNSFE